MKYLFVYGTLRYGERNWKSFIPDVQPMKRSAVTRPEFTMYSMGSFPAVKQEGNTVIVGDVFALPPERVKPIDSLEGHPSFYKRTPIVLEDGQKVEAYLINVPVDATRAIDTGDWLKWFYGKT